MKKIRKNGSVVAIVSLTILVVVLVGYIGYDKFLNKTTVNSTQENSDNKNANVNGNQNNNQTSSSNKVINFDRKNCINSNLSDKNVSNSVSNGSVDGLNFYTDESNEKIVKVQVNYKIMFPKRYSEDEIRNNTVKYYDEINLNFDKKVEEIFCGHFSPDYLGNVFIFLLEDGSLEYMKFSDIYNSQKYEHKPINGVNEIVKFGNIYIRSEEEVGGQYTTIAYKIDGTYYDLSKFIEVIH